jgi:hypothetical protein
MDDLHDAPAPRRPRIALMGEFSAGKSTLANLLLGEARSPVKVTATQLPPIWYVHGDGPMQRVDAEGGIHDLPEDGLAHVSPADTRHVIVPLEAEVLGLCDILDLPGMSDPNMDAAVWGRALDLADGVIWCTHATQAWRQSEAAVWDGVDPALYPRSMLLLTRIDKIVVPRDRERIVARVSREVEGMFRAVFPVSLTEALAAGDDAEVWAASGAEAFADALLALVTALGREIAAGNAPADRRVPRVSARAAAPTAQEDDEAGEDAPVPAPVNPFDRMRARLAGARDDGGSPEAEAHPAPAPSVLPRRVAVEVRTPRPARA